MVNIDVYDAKIFNKSKITAEIIKEYQKLNTVTITLNGFEGPCCESLGLYSMLDNICNIFEFDKKKITIRTSNLEERHNEYNIEIVEEWSKTWLTFTVNGLEGKTTESKHIDKNLFGCLYNTPTWHRLCLLAHVDKLNSSSVKMCNPTWELEYNRLWIDPIITEVPSEIDNITSFLKRKNFSRYKIPLDKENFNPLEIHDLYKDFFIEIVSETFVSGRSFFMTEKTIRPMYMKTPIIIMGPSAFLSNLKNRFGFKTFDAWWDERYDWQSQYDRIKSIYEITDMLDKLSVNNRMSMFSDMQEVLEHNYNRVLELNEQRR